MAQKNRKTYTILTIGIGNALLEAARAAHRRQKDNTRGEPLNFSAWVRRAIKRDIDHAERSRKKNLARTGVVVYDGVDNALPAE